MHRLRTMTLMVTIAIVTLVGIIPAQTEAQSGPGIFRSHPEDVWNWQTGVDQRFTIPFDWGFGIAQCAIIDAAHLRIDGIWYQGPLVIVVPGPFKGHRIEVIEGQVVVAKWGFFAKRLQDRLNVAWQQAQRAFVPDGHGGTRPRRESSNLRVLNTACPDDP